jgi:hypothetical protein|uniref:Uncharacterized protein n=1 Tax=Siphoviridae sp. ct7iJ31 TaxID=2826167 RepID=A0A8S5NSM3_9CAUD|nr:MAG TPA: hypothetical protein [Siphoviridae sp. ct7iJ31]DAI71911.1 MAG TPA: hypothetical protein [Caudoviricetes sp.]
MEKIIIDDMIKALKCVASQDADGDCYADHENFMHIEDEKHKRILCEAGEYLKDYISGKDAVGCPYHQNTYGRCFEYGRLSWLKDVAELLEELKSYKELEERLHKIFGEESTFSLADVIDTLEMKLSEPDKKHPVNARILTYEEADKWEEYKNLEEQGLLVRLPCKLNGTLYSVNYSNKTIAENTIIKISINDHVKRFYCIDDNLRERIFFSYRIGENVFLTREEAEKKLEEMKK